MQQHTPVRGQTPALAALWGEMERLVLRMIEVGPPGIVTVPLVIPMDLAQRLTAQSARTGLNVQELMVWGLVHGLYHAALEAGAPADARHMAAILRRLPVPKEWARCVQQHPEAQEGR